MGGLFLGAGLELGRTGACEIRLGLLQVFQPCWARGCEGLGGLRDFEV
jgi:hypothetical protein